MLGCKICSFFTLFRLHLIAKNNIIILAELWFVGWVGHLTVCCLVYLLPSTPQLLRCYVVCLCQGKHYLSYWGVLQNENRIYAKVPSMCWYWRLLLVLFEYNVCTYIRSQDVPSHRTTSTLWERTVNDCAHKSFFFGNVIWFYVIFMYFVCKSSLDLRIKYY